MSRSLTKLAPVRVGSEVLTKDNSVSNVTPRFLLDSQSVQCTPEELEGFVQVGLVVVRPVLSTIMNTLLKSLSHESFRSCPAPVLCNGLALTLGAHG